MNKTTNKATKKEALAQVSEAATARAIKISCYEDYAAEATALTVAREDARDAGCSTDEIELAEFQQVRS